MEEGADAFESDNESSSVANIEENDEDDPRSREDKKGGAAAAAEVESLLKLKLSEEGTDAALG